jgi:peptide chain release factor 3
MQRKGNHIAYDKDERPVYLAESEYMLTSAMRQYPEIQFHFISEHSQETA